MHYIVSLSGGAASAVAGERVIDRYGADAVTLWIADTRWEDDDLWRFVGDCCRRWGKEIICHTDGRTPLQVFEGRQIIPNSLIAPCSEELKIKPFRAFLLAQPKPVTVLLGLDWTEQHRHDAPRRNYEAIDGVTVDYPLMWEPIEFRPYVDVVRSWGIAPPRAYALGFPHNNCGGRCVRQGQREWNRLRATHPDRFAEVRDWEQEQRAQGGARAERSILKARAGGDAAPLTLLELEQRNEPSDERPYTEDMFGCFCTY